MSRRQLRLRRQRQRISACNSGWMKTNGTSSNSGYNACVALNKYEAGGVTTKNRRNKAGQYVLQYELLPAQSDGRTNSNQQTAKTEDTVCASV